MAPMRYLVLILLLGGCSSPDAEFHSSDDDDTSSGDDDDTTPTGPADPAFLTVFLDGAVAPGSDFQSISPGQPAVRYAVGEDDGSITHFFLDVSRSAAAFEHNFDVDTSVDELPVGETRVDFVLISHIHTLFGFGSDAESAGGIVRLLEDNPDLDIYLPDPTGLSYAYLDPVWEEIDLFGRAIILPEGFTQLTPRVGVFGTRFHEAEGDVIDALDHDELQENILVVDTGTGYHVHSVCGHLPVALLDDRVVHPIELLQAEIGDTIPDGSIHSIVTGASDAQRIGIEAGLPPEDAWSYTMESLHQNVPDLQRMGLAHCGFGVQAECLDVFGEDCVLGESGVTLDLAP